MEQKWLSDLLSFLLGSGIIGGIILWYVKSRLDKAERAAGKRLSWRSEYQTLRATRDDVLFDIIMMLAKVAELDPQLNGTFSEKVKKYSGFHYSMRRMEMEKAVEEEGK